MQQERALAQQSRTLQQVLDPAGDLLLDPFGGGAVWSMADCERHGSGRGGTTPWCWSRSRSWASIGSLSATGRLVGVATLAEVAFAEARRIIDRRSVKQWPIDLGPDFTAGKYDAYILGDLDAAALEYAERRAGASRAELDAAREDLVRYCLPFAGRLARRGESNMRLRLRFLLILVLAMLRPRVAVPVHWGTLHPPLFARFGRGWLDRPGQEFAEALAREAPGCEALVLEPGETRELPVADAGR